MVTGGLVLPWKSLKVIREHWHVLSTLDVVSLSRCYSGLLHWPVWSTVCCYGSLLPFCIPRRPHLTLCLIMLYWRHKDYGALTVLGITFLIHLAILLHKRSLCWDSVLDRNSTPSCPSSLIGAGFSTLAHPDRAKLDYIIISFEQCPLPTARPSIFRIK